MREEAGLTREQAAEVLSCTASKIGDLETGRFGPRMREHCGSSQRVAQTRASCTQCSSGLEVGRTEVPLNW
ncbi:MAG: helix-turn-helix domain-containing protein [Pseudonocardiaceae bacterium]